MESRQKILELVRRFEVLPPGHEETIRSWIADLHFALDEIFGSDSQYLQYLKYIKFHPEVVFVTDRERERSWKQGVAQLDNLLRVILNDPKVSDRIILDQAPSGSNDGHWDPSQDGSVERSLEEFKDAVKQRHPSMMEEGPMQEPLRVDSGMTAGPSVRQLLKEGGAEFISDQDKEQKLPRILCVNGHDAAVNEQVQEFLKDVSAQVMSIPNSAGQESLIDRLNKCAAAEFVVFILSADFHVYSKDQRPVDGGFMASQEAVFELGYLAAKFSRQNIVVLYEESENFIRPTEFFDLFYVPVTASGVWRAEVLRRMKGKLAIAAGLGLSVEDQTSA